MITIQNSSTSLNKFLQARFLGNSWRTVWSMEYMHTDVGHIKQAPTQGVH